MKICLISLDFYVDHNIILELKRRNINAHHIEISKFRYHYTSVFDRITNFLRKLFLKKNIKKIEMEKYVIKRLKELGPFDAILVIRPDKFTKQTHFEIKKHTNEYITYLYDSCTRILIDYLLNDAIFDRIFSFDLNDCQKYGFMPVTNYIYINKKELTITDNNIFIIMSIDNRFPILNKIADYLSEQNISYKFIVIGKRRPKNINMHINYFKKAVSIDDYKDDMENAKVFLDLVREEQTGLSFRVFEAMGMQKKLVTNNKSIIQYDFYNPNNIFVLDENNINIPPDFFSTPYQPLSNEVYHKYTIENWVDTVFKL